MDKKQFDNLISDLATILNERKGSDIILNANANPALIIDNQVYHIENKLLSGDDTLFIANTILNKAQFEQLIERKDANVMLEFPEHGNFRVNVFYNRGEVGLVLRLIPLKIPSFSDLQLPEFFKNYSALKRGMALFVGVTGVGKSTSLASIIDYRNSHLSDHIITIEDPIEFLHKNKKSVVTQREIDVDTVSYQSAVKSALRQAPDVVLIGEIRDQDVMDQAIALSETGHSVYSTIHANSAIQALERIINFYPREYRNELLSDLSSTLSVIVTQRLLLSASGKGRIIALEIMENTPYISELIREGKLSELNDAIKRDGFGNSITMDDFIFNLYEEDKVTYSESIKFVNSKHDFELNVKTKSNKPLPRELTNDGLEDDFSIEKNSKSYRKKNEWSGIV